MVEKNKKPIIYQGKDGAIELRGDLNEQVIFATQDDLSRLYEKDQSVISRHINNIFKDGEVDTKSNMQKMHIANSDKPVTFYSLDVILAVGYRANSSVAIEFRKWATKTLKKHITKGYTINEKVFERNKDEFLRVVEDIKKLSAGNTQVKTDDVLELVKSFSHTWFSLESYDKEGLPKDGFTKKDLSLEANDLYSDVATLKKELTKKGEATDLFAQEKGKNSLEGILGNVFQSAFGRDVYGTLEEKAAHLLYFIVKNHPFTDGNKRTGAFAFVWFL